MPLRPAVCALLRAPHLLPRGNSLWSQCSRDHFKVLGLCLVREGLGRRAWLGGRAGGGPKTAGSKRPCVLWDHWALGRNPPPLCAFRRGERVWVFLFLSLFLFQFYSESPGDLSRAPLNSASICSSPGPTQRSAQRGGSRTMFVWVEGREGKKGVIYKSLMPARRRGDYRSV